MDERRRKETRRARGRDTQSFFSDVVSELRDVPDVQSFRPEIISDEIFIADEWFEEVNTGAFDAHIVCSIPTYFEAVRAIAFAIVHHRSYFDLEVLVDLGASEGTFCAAAYVGSDGEFSAYAVEPNPEMVAKILEQPASIGVIDEILDPDFESAQIAEGGEVKAAYDFSIEADYVTEFMTFQFLGPEREIYIRRIRDCLSDLGVFVCCEKFSSHNLGAFLRNEMSKDAYKMRFFDTDTIEKKRLEVLQAPNGGMDEGMVTPDELEKILLQNFNAVAHIWDSGNFKGYVAGKDKSSVEFFVSMLPDLVSPFSESKTPCFLMSNGG